MVSVTTLDAGRRRVGFIARLALVHAVIMVSILGVLASYTRRHFAQQWELHARQDLMTLVTELRLDLASLEADNGELVAAAVAWVEHEVLSSEVAVVVLDAEGGVVSAVGAPSLAAVAGTGSGDSGSELSDELVAVEGADGPVRLLAHPLVSERRQVGTVVFIRDMRDAAAFTSLFARAAIVLAPVSAIVGALITYAVMRRLVRGISSVTATAARIAAEGVSERVLPVATTDDVGNLATTFNRMLDRLEAVLAGQRETLSEASHQLRTPLTVIRGHLEVQLRRGLDDRAEVAETMRTAVREVDHMNAVVGRLLDLASAWEPAALREGPVELAELLTEVYDAATALAPRRWAIGPIPSIVIAADATQLRGALLNLFENAVSATTPNDTVSLDVRLEGDLAITVADSGRGMAPAEVDVVTARFGRGAAAGLPGHGLGLAIVTAVAEAHGGYLVITSEPGNGAAVSVVLPADRVLLGGRESAGVR